MTQRKQARDTSPIPIERCHLFGIKSPHVLAKRLGWKLETLEHLAVSDNYRVFVHKKAKRLVEEPPAPLQSLHRQLHRYLARVITPAYLHSAVKGRSYLSNAEAHTRDEELIKIDVKKFFPSVPQHKVMHFFRDKLECAGDVAGLLANIICREGRLATGSAVSPIISYYAYKDMFDAIEAVALRRGLALTCYVDDITLSGKGASGAALHEVRTIIFRAGLRAHKERIFPSGQPKLVTGVMVSSQGIALPFSRWKKIRQHISEVNGCSNLEQRVDGLRRLSSRLYEASQVEPKCRKLAEQYHSEWKAARDQLEAASIQNHETLTASALRQLNNQGLSRRPAPHERLPKQQSAVA